MEGPFSYPITVLTGAAGSTTGAIGAYCLALYGGRPLLLERFKFLFKSEERLTDWENYFTSRGDRIIIIGRVISGVRMVISYPAGLFHMPFVRFVIYTFIGAVLWPVSAGYLLGPHVNSGIRAFQRVELPGAIVIVCFIAAIWFWRRRIRIRREEA